MYKPRYQIYPAGNKIIAVSSYAGKKVRGIAICSPEDEFDFDKGAELAIARCDEKIAYKRMLRAEEKMKEAIIQLLGAYEYEDKMSEYLYDASNAYEDAARLVEELEEDF